jgi:hypothetical protein
MFNVFLPKLLETGTAKVVAAEVPAGPAKSLEESLWDVVIFTVGGCPGAIVSFFFPLFFLSLHIFSSCI